MGIAPKAFFCSVTCLNCNRKRSSIKQVLQAYQGKCEEPLQGTPNDHTIRKANIHPTEQLGKRANTF